MEFFGNSTIRLRSSLSDNSAWGGLIQTIDNALAYMQKKPQKLLRLIQQFRASETKVRLIRKTRNSFNYYNKERKHSALDKHTSFEVFSGGQQGYSGMSDWLGMDR